MYVNEDILVELVMTSNLIAGSVISFLLLSVKASHLALTDTPFFSMKGVAVTDEEIMRCLD